MNTDRMKGFFTRRTRPVMAGLIICFGLSLYVGFEANRIEAQPKSPTTENKVGEKGKTGEPAKKEGENKKDGKGGDTKSDKTEPTRTPSTSIITLFRAGGPFMWPLLLASIISLMVVMERFYFYITTKMSKKTFQQNLADALDAGGLQGARKFLGENEKLAIADIISEGDKVSGADPELFSKGVEREAGNMIARSERGLPVLAAISTLAPLIGFLGTVSGMIGAFDAIANADTVNAKVVAGGIKEALITTAAGLIVAIPAMTFFQYFSQRVSGFATDVEQAANLVYKRMLQVKSGAENSARKEEATTAS